MPHTGILQNISKRSFKKKAIENPEVKNIFPLAEIVILFSFFYPAKWLRVWSVCGCGRGSAILHDLHFKKSRWKKNMKENKTV